MHLPLMPKRSEIQFLSYNSHANKEKINDEYFVKRRALMFKCFIGFIMEFVHFPLDIMK